ncbi:ATP-binding protein [Streptomyces sp. NPDC048361]|uniref:ATP-binding protein n=1 Tax=Streptomyces sp. NPDC048361 TaxID=3154720 RepID=UPI0034275801
MLTLNSSQIGPSAARKATLHYCRAHCPWVDPDEVVLVVAELLGNAIRHTYGPWHLFLDQRKGKLVAGVRDHSNAVPAPRAGGPDHDGGFGLGIVRRLASDLSVIPHPHGKTVQAIWVRTERPERTERPHVTAGRTRPGQQSRRACREQVN